jgi:hypothetical protein
MYEDVNNNVFVEIGNATDVNFIKSIKRIIVAFSDSEI